jgi:hypothetical protein
MKPIVLFRKQFDTSGEGQVAARHLPVVNYRSQVPPGSRVIGRFACLPFYDELETDLSVAGSVLINTRAQHSYIANFDYYADVQDYTFRTWFSFAEVPDAVKSRPFVVKGRTNSRKLQWRTHMFAPDFRAAMNLGSDLMNDPTIGPQGLVIREYEPLETFEIGINDVPMTNEWRLFFFRDKLLAYGYYWAIIDDLAAVDAARPDFERTGIPFARQMAEILMTHTNFFVVDIAKTVSGQWRLVEVNDGQQSGANEFIDADELYRELASALNK